MKKKRKIEIQGQFFHMYFYQVEGMEFIYNSYRQTFPPTSYIVVNKSKHEYMHSRVFIEFTIKEPYSSPEKC